MGTQGEPFASPSETFRVPQVKPDGFEMSLSRRTVKSTRRRGRCRAVASTLNLWTPTKRCFFFAILDDFLYIFVDFERFYTCFLLFF